MSQLPTLCLETTSERITVCSSPPLARSRSFPLLFIQFNSL